MQPLLQREVVFSPIEWIMAYKKESGEWKLVSSSLCHGANSVSRS